MFKINKNLKNLLKNVSVKKGIVVGASALALFGVAGATVNTNKDVHADENITALLKKASHTHPKSTLHVSKRQAEIANGGMKYNEADYSKKQITEMEHGANANKMIPAKLHKSNERINKRCKVNYRNIKYHKHVKQNKKYMKVHRVHKMRKVNLIKNSRGYKNYEVKNIAKTLNRIDIKMNHKHNYNYHKSINNMRHVNGQLGKLVGKHGSKSSHGYKNYEVKNIAKTLNRIDVKVRKMHGRKYHKMIKLLKHYNYLLGKIA